MSKLNEYIENLKKYIKENPNLTETELVRYVYLDLGKRLSFSLIFAFGNSKTRHQIYMDSRSEDCLNECMENNTAICKSISYILEYILKRVGVDIETVVDPNSFRSCSHMYNIVNSKEYNSYIIDLQSDLKNIKSLSTTQFFGLSIHSDSAPVISRFELEKIDKKLGYIDNENYYSDDYLYLIKSDMGYFSDLSEKAKFVIENIEIHENPNMKYAERKWHHERVLKELFTHEELEKICQVDCYEEIDGEKEYKNCIVVDKKGGVDIYMYSTEDFCYHQISIEDFEKEAEKGIIFPLKYPKLKQILKEHNRNHLNNENEER